MNCCFSLGTLGETREGCEVGAEPEDSAWWTYPEDGRTKRVMMGDARQASVI